MSEAWREERDRAAARFLTAWRRDRPPERAERVRTEAGRILTTWRSRAALDRDALWSAACWAQSALSAFREHGVSAAEQDLALAFATLQLNLPQRQGAA